MTQEAIRIRRILEHSDNVDPLISDDLKWLCNQFEFNAIDAKTKRSILQELEDANSSILNAICELERIGKS